MPAPMQKVAADISAATSVTTVSMTWIASLNEVLQLLATVVSIIAGAGAAWWYFDRVLENRRQRKEYGKRSNQKSG